VQGRIADARGVAEAGYAGMMAGKALVIPGFTNKLVPWLPRLLPRSMVTSIVRRAQSPVSR
jgi:short-subunit dehydrogenase